MPDSKHPSLKDSGKKFPEAFPPGWKEKLSAEFEKDYFTELKKFIQFEIQGKKTIYPALPNIFQALEDVDLPSVKVVILGQDPYHGEGQAIGRSFAVPDSLWPKPPSLKNIFKEIEDDLKVTIHESESDLSGWAEQGVLMLNTVLTVRANQPFSHREKGWEHFTDVILDVLAERAEPMVFILWGAAAVKKKQIILKHKRQGHPPHLILESAHPSPLSAYRGFFGSRHFSKANSALTSWGQQPIYWENASSVSSSGMSIRERNTQSKESLHL